MTVSAAQRELLDTDRWAWLRDVVDRWYAEPLTAADGSPPADLEAAAARVGGALPVGLAEWFTLVGRRLRAVQDCPATPGAVRRDGAGVVVWTENQDVWSLVVRADGVCVVEDFPFPPTPVATAVHGMVLGDTLVGAWAGSMTGPLGRLADSVRGGRVEEALDYPELAVPGNPFRGVPPRGDVDTVVRGNEAGWEWMTASRAAFERLDGLVPLDPPGGAREVVVAFEDLTAAERAVLTREHGVPDVDRFAVAAGTRAQLRMAAAEAGGVRFHLVTERAEETVAAVLGAVPEGVADKVVVAVRPERISRFRVVHPVGRDEYVLPG
ncbi:hypothetical protein [Actinosynnema sp. NPDC020468]|uniref:hypothetical protein n=1 Tax=Actinosynnema sp. NPDC020468 TaxID=3154488 RepID=UPI0034037960